MLAKAYTEKHSDAVILFYDSEFGSPQSYFENFGIDPEKVFHTPITDVEVLKNDIMNQLENIERGDHIFIIIDSIGNLASKKEVEDALKGSSAADMTRAKALKSLGRMITSHLTLKNIPLIAINHIYMTQEMFSKPVVGGGTGLYLSAHDVWILGRQQDKNEKTKIIEGYDFIINVDKSRYVKEKTKIPISITYENGIDVKSGLFEQALAGGFIKEVSKGYYNIGEDTTKRTRKDIEALTFLLDLCEDDAFKTYIRKKFQTGYTGEDDDEG
jgi:RecA/RadA recombinase